MNTLFPDPHAPIPCSRPVDVPRADLLRDFDTTIMPGFFLGASRLAIGIPDALERGLEAIETALGAGRGTVIPSFPLSLRHSRERGNPELDPRLRGGDDELGSLGKMKPTDEV